MLSTTYGKQTMSPVTDVTSQVQGQLSVTGKQPVSFQNENSV